MIERQVDVIQRVSNLVRDGRREPADDDGFLSIVKLCLQLARAPKFHSHLIEQSGQLSHLIPPLRSANAIGKVTAGNTPRRYRQRFDRPGELPDDDRRQTSHRQQYGKRINKGLPSLAPEDCRHGVRGIEHHDHIAATLLSLHRKVERAGRSGPAFRHHIHTFRQRRVVGRQA